MGKEYFWLCLFVLGLAGGQDIQDTEDCNCTCSCCFMPSQKNCAHYCFCSEAGSKGTKRKCPGNLMFNPEIMNCDEPENFRCFEAVIPPLFRCDSTKDDYYPFPNKCDHFIQCSNGIPNVHKCAHTTHWCQNCSRPTCQHPEIAGCDNSKALIPPKQAICVHERLYPNPQNCGSFYQCSHNSLILRKCPENLHFCSTCDPPRCNFPSLANCIQTNYEASDIFTSLDEVKLLSPYFNSDSGDAMECPLPDGLYPVPADPTLYLLCRSGVGAFFHCPPRKTFDPQVLGCVLQDTRPWNRRISTGECQARMGERSSSFT